VIVARVVVEVGWERAARLVAADFGKMAKPPIQPGIFDAYVTESLSARVALRDRLDHYSHRLFGFSLAKDWDDVKWGRLNSFFELRNDVVHEGIHPQPDQAWNAISLSREVLERLVELRVGVTTQVVADGKSP